MTDLETRSCTVETSRAKESVKDFFESCVPGPLRKHFASVAKHHYDEINSQVVKLKKAIENPGDVQSHVLYCGFYVKESKKLIRLVSFRLLTAYPNFNPEEKFYWQD